MAIRKTLKIGDPQLKATNELIKDFQSPILIKLVVDLEATMHKKGLIGIAAPQIGKNYQVFVTEPRNTPSRNFGKGDKLRVYINPRLIYSSEEQVEIYEGCGSVPGIFGPISRPKVITIEAYNLKGEMFQLKADGILARVIQHEIDHLNSLEFIQKTKDISTLIHKEYYLKNIRNSKQQIERSQISIKEYKNIEKEVVS